MRFLRLILIPLLFASNIANAQINCLVGSADSDELHKDFVEKGIKYRFIIEEERDIITMKITSHTCYIYATSKDGGYSGDITIPASTSKGKVTGIDASAFAGSTKLTSVTIANGIKTIGHGAFNN